MQADLNLHLAAHVRMYDFVRCGSYLGNSPRPLSTVSVASCQILLTAIWKQFLVFSHAECVSWIYRIQSNYRTVRLGFSKLLVRHFVKQPPDKARVKERISSRLHERIILKCLCGIITKTCLFKYTENFTTKKWKFSDKKVKFFIFLL